MSRPALWNKHNSTGPALSPIAEFLSRLSQRGDIIFTTRQAQEFWGEPALTWQVLNRLQRKGWIERLEL